MAKQKEPDALTSVDPKDAINLAYRLASVHALCITPFIRNQFGTHAFMGGPYCILMMFAWAGAMPSAGMLIYLLLWCAMVAFRRIFSTDRNQQSVYDGYPFIGAKFPFVKTEFRAKCMEVLLCQFVGIPFIYLSPGIGGFILLGAVSIGFVESVDRTVEQQRLRQMRDAALYQQYLADKFRDRR